MNKKYKWPALPYDKHSETLDALHMKMQVVGKIKLALCPFLNQWWQIALFFNARGLTTGPVPYKNDVFEIIIDFIDHKVSIHTSGGEVKSIKLKGCTVAVFYSELMSSLDELGVRIRINTLPSEVPDPVHCYEDNRSAYDEEYVTNWWLVQLRSKMIFDKFRTSFRGKSSPVHFFWGSFDLNHARFSGKKAVPPESGGIIMKYAENEENFSCGFWAGSRIFPKPAFYSYMYPVPAGITDSKVMADRIAFNRDLGLYVLEYDDVRNSIEPDAMILDFLNSTFNASAKLAMWDTEGLKAEVPGDKHASK